MRQFINVLLLAAMTSMLFACGQTGGLYLPKEPTAANTTKEAR
jgi:predicted small lipoprotein YifL